MSRQTQLRTVLEKIKLACQAAKRDPSQVRLLAISKTFPAEALQEVYGAGQRHFGENYVQELADKRAYFDGGKDQPGAADITWHFTGRVQRNKAKHIALHASYVHALEKLSHAEAIGRHAETEVKAFVSVNIGREDSKGGVLPEDALELCAAVNAVDGIALRGLMCIPPRSTDPEASAPYFEALAELAAQGRSQGLPLHELSMGMSHDFHVAIRYGATWLRVGSAIFGERKRPTAPSP